MLRIDCNSISKKFYRSGGPQLLRSHVTGFFARKELNSFYALKDVTFRIAQGESLAVIGRNGAGKSTLLSLISGLSRPDEGSLAVSGRVTALFELGSGFHPDLTGLENIALNASLLGFREQQFKDLIDPILDFAQIGDFVYEPLRTYSSGMVMRLAFSVAVNLEPEILIIDEILAVGDAAFQTKCFDRILQFRKQGRTIVAVSHASTALLELCDRGIWLDHGKVIIDGEINSVMDAYARQAFPAESVKAAAHTTRLPDQVAVGSGSGPRSKKEIAPVREGLGRRTRV